MGVDVYTPMMRVISGSYNIRCIHMRATASFGSSLVFILYTERESVTKWRDSRGAYLLLLELVILWGLCMRK